MGIMERKCNKAYCVHKKKIKKAIYTVAELMPKEFTDEYFVETFKRLYPNLWEDLDKQYKYWRNAGQTFSKPFKFVLDASKVCRKKTRNDSDRIILDSDQIEKMETEIRKNSLRKLERRQEKVRNNLYYIQEIEPAFAKAFIREYFRTHDLHERLEIMRELSKFKSDEIVSFFTK